MDSGKRISIMKFLKNTRPLLKMDRKVVFGMLDEFMMDSVIEFYSKKTEEILNATGITRKQLLIMVKFGQMYHLFENTRLPRLQMQQQSTLNDANYEELARPFYNSIMFDKNLKMVANICVYIFRFFIYLFRYEKMDHTNQNHDEYFLFQAKDKWEELIFYTLELTEIQDNLYILESITSIIDEFYLKFKKILRIVEPILSEHTYSVSNNFMYDTFIVTPWVYQIYDIMG